MKLFYIDNIYISGAISNFDQLSEKTVQEFTSTLSKKLIANNYKIYSYTLTFKNPSKTPALCFVQKHVT